jgi:lipoprotein-releasing system permease protein
MFSKLEFSIASRYLRSKRKEGFVSIVSVFSFLGIMLGVATLIVTMAVMSGVKTELINRIIGINAHISINSATGKIENYNFLNQQILKVKGVVYSNPAVYGQSLATVNDENVGVQIRGIDSIDLNHKKIIRDGITIGKLYDENQFEAMAGVFLAKRMGLTSGTTISLISPSFNQTLMGNIPRLKAFVISGVFDSGMYEYDSSVLFIPLEAAQKFFTMKDSVSSIDIEVDDPKNLEKIKEDIFELIKDTNYYITDWKDANSGFLESIDVQSNVLFLILALIILVAAFNVISGMVMLVNNKNKEIAILRTIGMKRNSVIRIFIICGSTIGIVGTIFGLILGLSFAANIDEIKTFLESISNTNLFSAEVYFLSKLPAELRAHDVINIVGLSFSLSILSTIYPAWKASRIAPAEALKYE